MPRPDDSDRVTTADQKIALGHVVGDRYQLVERIGTGAMGEVFVAENLAIRLRVAVKLLKPELLADAVFRERFQQEAQAVAAIDHPNVARFLDLVVGDPTFLVMEYVRGQTLAERLRATGPFPVGEAVEIATRLCWALHAAHAAGVIHRDLKPSNVILTPDVERGETPKLIDFGLAKLARTQEGSGLTRTGQVVGTPRYMSPEQIAGGPVDARADQYALGCLLYELLAGRPAFAGDDDVQVLYQQIHHDPPPLRNITTSVPDELADVVARTLKKDPAARWPSMPELARALGRTARTARGVEERRAPQPAKPWRWLLIVPLVLLLAGGGFAGGRWLQRRGRAPVAPTGGLLLISDPPGARVELDGKPVARETPTWIAEVAPGAHSVKIWRPGSQPVTQAVTLRPDERAVVQVTLGPSSHRVEVRSAPDGAQVYLDGRLMIGQTPTFVDVTDDDFHELRVLKSGYRTESRALTPDDKLAAVAFTLTPETEPRGAVVVEASAPSEVWIDDLDTGYTTPTLAIQIPIGKHTIELRDGRGGRGAPQEFTVERGQTLRLTPGAP